MSLFATSVAARWLRRAFCLLTALALSLLCALVAVGGSMSIVSVTPSDEGSAHVSMTAAVAAESMTGTSGMADAVASIGVAEAGRMASMCDGMCASDIADACMVVAALTVTTLLALLLARRRETFLGLTTRALWSTQRRWSERWREPAPSLTELCVLRV